jgi:uncharacterized protein (TIGR02246 family)
VTDDERAIRKAVETWMMASKTGDLETVLGLMTEDVVFMTPGREPFGKKEFAAQSAGMKTMRIEGVSDIREIQVAGEWAWLRNHISITVTPPGGNAKRRSGYTLTVFRKLGDRWLLARDANLVV